MKDALMEYETIDADQVDDLMARRKVRPPHQWDDNNTGSSGGASSASKTPPKGPKVGDPVEGV
jgi:cell division protease FtsH